MAKDNLVHFDWAIKRLLRQKSNFVVLEGLLSTLLGEEIKINRLLESEGNKENRLDKFNRVDLLAENSKGELIIVEVQNNRELNYFHRMLYGVSKAITEYIYKGEPYANVKKVYSINIVYFDLGQGYDYVYHGFMDFKGIHTGDTLKLSAHQREQFMFRDAGELFPEYYVLRVDEFDQKAVTPLDEWISFLKTGDIPEDVQANGLVEAKTRLRYDRLNEKEKQEYDAHMESLRYQQSVLQTGMIEGKAEGKAEGKIEGKAEGLAEGLAKGKRETALAIAGNALNKGMSPEDVMELTGLEKADLEAI
jgi:predicted transposase/invertase (TIGR01784 family)